MILGSKLVKIEKDFFSFWVGVLLMKIMKKRMEEEGRR